MKSRLQLLKTLSSITCMQTDLSGTSSLPVRDDLKSALGRAWSEVAQVGDWLNAEQRLAIAGEARQAWHCKLCGRRKQALSPYAIEGVHDHLGVLPESWIEAVHRIVTDSGRITESWYDSMIATGIVEDEFIELLGVATSVTCMDTFMRGIGLAPEPYRHQQGRVRRRESGRVARKRGRVGRQRLLRRTQDLNLVISTKRGINTSAVR
jgi:hypothetical protein